MLGQVLAHLDLHTGIVRLPCVEAVNIAVVHAESRGDKNGVINLDIRCP